MRTELAGDASTRRFFRETAAGGSTIAMEYGHPLDSSGDAFLEMADYLAKLGVPVPRVFHVDREAGRVVLEDLGDVTLELAVASRPRSAWLPLYEQAIDVVRRIQDGARAAPAPDIQGFQTALDEAKLTWELGFFREHYVEGYRRVALAPPDRSALDAALGELARAAAERPFVLCHRDFHARNIMVRDDAIALVDFQDARLGARAYDLASLLHDSYVTLDEPAREHLLARYAGGPPDDALARELVTSSLQRSLKALGTFGYQIHVRGKLRYADAVPRTLEHLSSNFLRDERWSDLHTLLNRLHILT